MEELERRSIRTQQETYNIQYGVVINSFYTVWYRGSHREGHMAVPVGDQLILQVIRGREWLEKVDTIENRVTYLEEFRARYGILTKNIRDGSLDGILIYPPFTILYMINGRHGELLEELGIDPEEGITQQRFRRAAPIKVKAEIIYG